MNRQQQDFLERLALRIPRLFDAIAQGNVKSEYIIGVRCIGTRHVRLKLVAEVADPGANPLATHGQMKPETQSTLRSVDLTALNDEAGADYPAGVGAPQGAGAGNDAIAWKRSGADPGADPKPDQVRIRDRIRDRVQLHGGDVRASVKAFAGAADR